MVELKIKENEAGQRLDKYLHKYLKEAGNGFLYKMLRKKNITLNGKKAAGSEKLCIGDVVKLFLSDETIRKFGGWLQEPVEVCQGPSGRQMGNICQEPSGRQIWDARQERDERQMGNIRQELSGRQMRDACQERDEKQMWDIRQEPSGRQIGDIRQGPAGKHAWDGRAGQDNREKGISQYIKAYRQFGELGIIFENHHVLIVDKPAGILTQKAAAGDVSLNEWLVGYLLEKGELTERELHTFHPSVCNRLDRNTSGMVICGKTLLGSQKMSGLLRERGLRKYYRMYVKGLMEGAFLAEGYLVKDGRTNTVRLAECAKGASYIRTDYRPLEHYQDMTLAEAELVTGKTHQIRLHLAAIGHPLVGDYKYGDKGFNDKYKEKYGVKSQLLHAYRLEFPVMEGEFRDLSGVELVAGEPEIFGRIDEGESDGNLEFQRA